MIEIEKKDILSNDEYKEVRSERRKELVAYKKTDALVSVLLQLFILNHTRLCCIKFKKCSLLKELQKAS